MPLFHVAYLICVYACMVRSIKLLNVHLVIHHPSFKVEHYQSTKTSYYSCPHVITLTFIFTYFFTYFSFIPFPHLCLYFKLFYFKLSLYMSLLSHIVTVDFYAVYFSKVVCDRQLICLT
jgi:hypothetical protein